MTEIRKETDSLGEVDVPADKLWGAQTQRSLEHFSIGTDLIPREMIGAYAILKKAAANANYAGKRLDDQHHKLIVQVCDEILAGQHQDMFPLHVWMTGSGTQFNPEPLTRPVLFYQADITHQVWRWKGRPFPDGPFSDALATAPDLNADAILATALNW